MDLSSMPADILPIINIWKIVIWNLNLIRYLE